MSGPSGGALVLGAIGALIVLAVLADVFVTVFNYDALGYDPD